MKKGVKELTDGMQRLCAVANRIVSDNGKVSRIEVDLLMDNLRKLYDVALDLLDGASVSDTALSDAALMSSTMMATRAAMGNEQPEADGRKWNQPVQAAAAVKAAKVELPEEPVEKPAPEEPKAIAEEPKAVVEEPKAVVEEPKAVVEEPKVVVEEPKAIVEETADRSQVTDHISQPVEPMHIMAEVETENSLMFDEVVIETEPTPETVAEPEPIEQKPEPVHVPEPEPVPEPKPVEPKADDREWSQQKPEPKPVERKPEPATEQTSMLFDQEETKKPTPKQETKQTATAKSQPSLLDYLKHPVEETPTVRTLGETLRGVIPTSNTLEHKVSDLRTVININDKFSFMTELFRNNMKAYNDFILKLNEMATREEALAAVEEVAAQYQWDADSMAVKNFYKVFDKKF